MKKKIISIEYNKEKEKDKDGFYNKMGSDRTGYSKFIQSKNMDLDSLKNVSVSRIH